MADQLPQSLPKAYHPWAAHAIELFRALGMTIDVQDPPQTDAAQIETAMKAKLVAEMANSEMSKVRHYVENVRDGISMNTYQPARYLAVVADRPRRLRLAQLRTGSHWLRVEMGRWQRLKKEERLCPHCPLAAIEDETHLVFDCPKYSGLRQRFAVLFTAGDRKLSAFLSQDPVVVAEFIRQCYLCAAQL